MLKGLYILLNRYGPALFIASLFTIIMKEIYLCHSGLRDVVKEKAEYQKIFCETVSLRNDCIHENDAIESIVSNPIKIKTR